MVIQKQLPQNLNRNHMKVLVIVGSRSDAIKSVSITQELRGRIVIDEQTFSLKSIQQLVEPIFTNFFQKIDFFADNEIILIDAITDFKPDLIIFNDNSPLQDLIVTVCEKLQIKFAVCNVGLHFNTVNNDYLNRAFFCFLPSVSSFEKIEQNMIVSGSTVIDTLTKNINVDFEHKFLQEKFMMLILSNDLLNNFDLIIEQLSLFLKANQTMKVV